MSEIFIPVIIISIICTLFFFWRVSCWIGFRLWLIAPLLLGLLLCFWYPIINAPEEPQTWTSLMGFAGNTWMVLVGIFVLFAMFFESIRAMGWLFFKQVQGEGRDILPPWRSVPLTLCMLMLFTGWSVVEAQNPRVTRLTLQTDKLPAGVNNYRIVYLADLHLHELSGEKFLGRITKLIAEQNSDLLLFGGDIVSSRDMRSRQMEASMLAKVMPPNGSLGILGNHEARFDHLGNAIPFLKRAWIHVMRGEAVAVGSVYVVGIDDPKVAETQGTPVHDPMIILNRIPRERFIILLKHRPEIQAESVGLFDLQLSAHTHGGQIWPLRYPLAVYFGAPQGRMDKISGPNGESWYYCTTGTGFSGLPLRFLTPPEIVVIDLVR